MVDIDEPPGAGMKAMADEGASVRGPIGAVVVGAARGSGFDLAKLGDTDGSGGRG